MSYYLFLDDARKPSDVTWVTLPENVAWVVARSYEDFVAVLDKMGLPKFITYDCDLSVEHYNAFFELKHNYILKYNEFKNRCGISCVEHILKFCKARKVAHPPYLVHTRNHYAKPFMEQMIENFNANPIVPEGKDLLDAVTPLPSFVRHNENEIAGFFGEYRFLSNFWPAPIRYLHIDFPSVEVAYQCAKCAIPSDRQQFLTATSSTAKQLGKKVLIRSDWDEVKASIMFDLVLQKFTNHPELRQKLIDTGSRNLEESNNWKDKYWGVYYKYNRDTRGFDYVGGQNRLGTILMLVRNRLQKL